MSEIRVLAARQPWASLIVEGLKTIEVRSRPTNIRERVAIYASNWWYSEKEIDKICDYYKKLLNKGLITEYIYSYACNSVLSGGQRGYIIGSVELSSVSNACTQIPFNDIETRSRETLAPLHLFNEKCQYYFWHLKNPIKYEIPIPYKPPKGAVIWSKTELPEVN